MEVRLSDQPRQQEPRSFRAERPFDAARTAIVPVELSGLIRISRKIHQDLEAIKMPVKVNTLLRAVQYLWYWQQLPEPFCFLCMPSEESNRPGECRGACWGCCLIVRIRGGTRQYFSRRIDRSLQLCQARAAEGCSCTFRRPFSIPERQVSPSVNPRIQLVCDPGVSMFADCKHPQTSTSSDATTSAPVAAKTFFRLASFARARSKAAPSSRTSPASSAT